MSATPTPRVTLKINGSVFSYFTSVDIERDLKDLTGRFSLKIFDPAASAAAFPSMNASPFARIRGQEPVTILLDTEIVLVGYLEKPRRKWTGTGLEFTLSGRDRTGDLVECAALPNGPAEFRNVGLLQVAQTVCAPFGIPVKTDVDLGAPFDRLKVNPHDTAMRFLESAARQRSALMASDGVGGLLFTRGGTTRAPDALRLGANVWEAEDETDWSHRFSDYYVMGQTPPPRGGTPALTHATVPSDPDIVPTAPAAKTTAARQYIAMTGHAIDPEVTRYRPVVRLTKTQSGMSSMQEQAEWALRVAKGNAVHRTYTVLDWRAGPGGPDNARPALWRPNAQVAVWNPLDDIDADQLIAGVRYLYDDKGARTVLRLVGLSAYDRINEAARKRQTTGGKSKLKTPPKVIDAS